MAITFVRKTWTDQILTRLGRSVTHTPVTKTIHNTSGAETLSEGTPVNIAAVFLRRQARWMFDKDGLIEGGDAYVLVNTSTATITKDDLITVNSREYRVNDTIIRYTDDSNSTSVYQYCNLFLND